MENYTSTKIVCTIGPACNTKEKIMALAENGADMFRLNASHGDFAQHEEVVKNIRAVEAETKSLIPIMIDLQGPKIRVGELPEPIKVNVGDILQFQHKDNYDGLVIPVDYKGIAEDVKPGDKILIDDGKIQLIATEINNDIVSAKVLTKGVINKRKGINIPGATGSLEVMSEKDVEYVKKAVEWDVDYIALSFVRCADDVKFLRELIKNSDIKIISKIEKPQAIRNIDEIIAVSDGIMVARGDLGIETPAQEVPIVQKTIVEKANVARKCVIVATQMLESMITNPIPTRAEVSDVANAIFDGADAVMLSGETAVGAYPEATVKMMDDIAKSVQYSERINHNRLPEKMFQTENTASMAIGVALTDMIRNIPNVKAIVTISQSGYTPKLISESNPSVPVFACCTSQKLCRQLRLYRCVYPLKITGAIGKIDQIMLTLLSRFLVKNTFLKKGDMIIVTGSVPHILEEGTNFIKIHTI